MAKVSVNLKIVTHKTWDLLIIGKIIPKKLLVYRMIYLEEERTHKVIKHFSLTVNNKTLVTAFKLRLINSTRAEQELCDILNLILFA